MSPEEEVRALRRQVREMTEAMAGSTLKEEGQARNRRSEMTPGRVVDFEVDDEGDATRSGMSKEALEHALKAAEIRVRQLEATPRWRGRVSVASEGRGDDRDGSHAKAKLERPKIFNGDYSEVYN
eukprot:3933989-Rhodomonas_salina.1